MGDGRQHSWEPLRDGAVSTTVEVAVDGAAGEVVMVNPGSDRDSKTNGVVVSHKDHLPQGIHETEEELKHRWFVGSIDQGTTSSRFLIFNGEGDPVAMHQIEFENLYPKSG